MPRGSNHLRDGRLRKTRRRQVWAREVAITGEVRCCYCGAALTPDTMTLEHKTPLSHGGTWSLDNLAASCLPCNQERGRATDWAAHAARRPRVAPLTFRLPL